MSDLGTVVVGFDGSDTARDALALGALLARAAQAPLAATFVYRIDPLDLGEDESDFHAFQRDVALRELQAARDADPSPELIPIGARSVARGLHELASSQEAGFVVVGSTHRGPVGRILLGSTAQRLLAGAPCPVAVAPRGFAERAGDGGAGVSVVVAGVDGGEDSVAAARTAARLAAAFGARLRLVSVLEPPALPLPGPPAGGGVPQAALESARHWALSEGRARRERTLERVVAETAAAAGVEAEPALLEGSPADALLAEAPEDGGLIVVGSRGYGPVGAVLMGSVASDVMHHARCPVVVVPRAP